MLRKARDWSSKTLDGEPYYDSTEVAEKRETRKLLLIVSVILTLLGLLCFTIMSYALLPDKSNSDAYQQAVTILKEYPVFDG